MALLATTRRVEVERPSLTRSFGAAFGFVVGSRRVSAEFLQDVLPALGVIAELVGAPSDVRQSIAETIAAVAPRTFVPTSEVIDRLLDLRRSAVQGCV